MACWLLGQDGHRQNTAFRQPCPQHPAWRIGSYLELSMISIAALRALAAGGISPSALIDFIEAQQEADLAAEDKARAKNRDRQQRWRDRKTLRNVTSRYVTVTERDTEETQEKSISCQATLPEPTENGHIDTSFLTSSLPLEVKEKKESKGGLRARGTRLDAGAILTDEFHEAAVVIGADPRQIPKIWAEFVDYWCAVPGLRGRKTDWPATWRNRIRTITAKGQSKNGKRTVHEAADDLLERIRAFDNPLSGGTGGDQGENVVRLLSPR
jgi:hypothetical protein